MRVCVSVESYAVSAPLLRALGDLLAASFANYALAIEADTPPHRTVDDLCATARVLEAASIPFGLDGPWIQIDPGHPRRRRILSVDELALIHEAAVRQFRWVRIPVGAGSPTIKPARFADVLGFCRAAGLVAQVVVNEADWASRGWSRLLRARGPEDFVVLHRAAVTDLVNPPRFLVAGRRRGDLAAWGYCLELGRGFPYDEADLQAVTDVVHRNRVAGASCLSVYPLAALVEGFAALPAHLHAWPDIDTAALHDPTQPLRLTRFGEWLADLGL